ncbi:MAG: type 2 lanthipeptide synthetase LanM family protein [Verrucomicrobiae bacterium]|nr:type 2 lanthipeptide synthetase LanM family protein [Verrucomicrobiae bacterium]
MTTSSISPDEESFLREIASKALSLDERLGGWAVEVSSEKSREMARKRLAAWRSGPFRDNPDGFSKRLAMAGVRSAADENVLALLGDVQLAPRRSLPDWVEWLEKILVEARQGAQTAEENKVLPFHEFFVPFLKTAEKRLQTAVPARRLGRLSESARKEVRDALLCRLGQTCHRVLDAEWVRFLKRAKFEAPPQFSPGDPIFLAQEKVFLKELTGDGLVGFTRKYPVLLRLVCMRMDFWVAALAEFLERLEKDGEALAERFHGGRSLGIIAGMDTSVADSHNCGRSVFLLRFDDGFRLVYKPRNCAMEKEFFGWLDWLKQREPWMDLKTLQVLDGGSYGWMEFASDDACRTMDEAGAYHRRMGQLLALIHAMAGTDFHYENILASGAFPIPVDLEMLALPYVDWKEPSDEDGARALAVELMSSSVFATGMLPQWVPIGKDRQFNPGGMGVDQSSGLERLPAAAGQGGVLEQALKTWHVEDGPRHLPVFDGRPVTASAHVEKILDGFCAMYDVLLKHREELLAGGGPLQSLGACPVRFLNRATSLYARILNTFLNPSVLGDGVDASFKLEIVFRSLMGVRLSLRDKQLAIMGCEMEAMERGDVPYFQTSVGGRDLLLPNGGRVESFFAISGIERARKRLEGFSAADRQLQLKFIRQSFALIAARHVISIPADSMPEPYPSDFSPAQTGDLIGEAGKIAGFLEKNALVARESVVWISPQLMRNSECYQLAPIGMGLYDGLSGVSLFLAAYARITGERRHAEMAGQALDSFLRDWENPQRRIFFKLSGLGMGSGLGGVIHALCLCADLLGNRRLVSVAGQMAGLIDEEMIAKDEDFDIILGCAGAILTLLGLHGLTGDVHALDMAVCCGERLLKERKRTSTGHLSWKSAGVFLTGYSHGAAGFAHALAALGKKAGRADFTQAAIETLEFEDALFDEKVGNWPDLRPHEMGINGAKPFLCAWCHGAAGIAMGRLKMLEFLDAPDIRRDLDRALNVMRNAPLGGVDQCCCGNLGRAEILWECGRRLGCADDCEKALRIVQGTIQKSREQGGYCYFNNLPPVVPNAGFFQGMSGIGYSFLRMSGKGALPCVLAMERTVD